MKKYLQKNSISPIKAFLLFQLLGLIGVIAILTLATVMVPKVILWLLILLAVPYVGYASAVVWVNTGNPKLSVVSALAKLWCVLYVLYGLAVLWRVAT